MTQKPQRLEGMKNGLRLISVISFKHGGNNRSRVMTRPVEGIVRRVIAGFATLERYYHVATIRVKVGRSHLVGPWFAETASRTR